MYILLRKLDRATTIAREEGIPSLARSTFAFVAQHLSPYRHKYLSRTGWYRLRHPRSTAPPYRLIDIDPVEVDSLTVPHFGQDLPTDATHVVGGDWDETTDGQLNFFGLYEGAFAERKSVPLDDYLFYRSVEAHIQRGTPWRDTAFYDWVTSTDALPDGVLYSREETRQWRFDQLDRLATSMREEGYKTQRECHRDPTAIPGGDEVKGSTRQKDVPPEHHEIAVNIGRDGEPIFEEGRHRFAVARALGIESIPVRVFVRHEEWQRKRLAVARATDPAELRAETRALLSHPDMSDVATGLRTGHDA